MERDREGEKGREREGEREGKREGGGGKERERIWPKGYPIHWSGSLVSIG